MFDTKLQTILDIFKMSIKKTNNGSSIIIIVFIDLHVAITKILEPKVRPGKGAVEDFIYWNIFNIKNNKYTLVLQLVSSHSKIIGNKKVNIIAKNVGYKIDKRTDH